MYFKILFTCLASAALCLAAGSWARAQNNSPRSTAETVSSASDTDTAFVQQAAKGGIAEVELSRIAVTGAASSEVRSFAKEMVDAHTANNRELASVAGEQGISIPKETDEEHIRLRQKLSALRGAEFDKAYIEAMKSDHQKMAELLQYSAKTVHSPQLRTYIDKTLPVVRHHLAMAQKLEK